MNKYRVLGLVCGITVGALIMMIFFLLRKKKGGLKYDERQMAVRANCYKVAYWVLSMYVVLYAILMATYPEVSQFLGMVGLCYGFLLSIGVFAILCIWNNAYEAINENKQWPLTLVIIGISNIIIAVANFMSHGIIEDGSLSFPWLNLGCAILLILVVFAKWIRNRVDERDEA